MVAAVGGASPGGAGGRFLMGETWLIVAVLIGADGLPHTYRPAVEFDLDSCRRQAHALNTRWLAEHQVGVVTCRLEHDEPR